MKIKKKLKKKVKSFLRPFLDKLGFVQKQEIVSKPVSIKNELIADFFNTIKNLGFIPKHIVDIGANRGTWTREVLHVFPDAIYTLFEPQERLKSYMKDVLANPNIEFNAMGVGKQNGNLKFTILDRDDSCSFIYSEGEAKKMGYEQVTVPVITLNDYFKNSLKPIPDLIKIDAEGLDLDVLEGASNLLGKVEVVLVEACVVSKSYKNDIKTVINKMDEYGYTLFDVTDLNRPFPDLKVLWLTELAFVLKRGCIINQKFY